MWHHTYNNKQTEKFMNNGNILVDFSETKQIGNGRRKLLPWWIKAFIWFFMIAGVLVIPVFVMGLAGYSLQVEIYGLKTTRPISILGILLLLVFLLKSTASFSLWFQTYCEA